METASGIRETGKAPRRTMALVLFSSSEVVIVKSISILISVIDRHFYCGHPFTDMEEATRERLQFLFNISTIYLSCT